MSMHDRIVFPYAGQLLSMTTDQLGEGMGEFPWGSLCPGLGAGLLVEDMPVSAPLAAPLHGAAIGCDHLFVDFSFAPLPQEAAFLARRAQSLWSNPFWRAKGFARLAQAAQWRETNARSRQEAFPEGVHDWRLIEDEPARAAKKNAAALFGLLHVSQAKTNVDGRDLETLMRDLTDAVRHHSERDGIWPDHRLAQSIAKLTASRGGGLSAGKALPSSFLPQSLTPPDASKAHAAVHAWLSGFSRNHLTASAWAREFNEMNHLAARNSGPIKGMPSAPTLGQGSIAQLIEQARVDDLCALLQEQPALAQTPEITQLLGILASSRLFAPELVDLLGAGARAPRHLALSSENRVEFWVGLALMGWPQDALLGIAPFMPALQDPLPPTFALPVFTPACALLDFDAVSLRAPDSVRSGAAARQEGFDWALRAALDGYEPNVPAFARWLELGANPLAEPEGTWDPYHRENPRTTAQLLAEGIEQRGAMSLSHETPETSAFARCGQLLLEASAGQPWQAGVIAAFKPVRAMQPSLSRLEAQDLADALPKGARKKRAPPKSL